MKYVIEKELSKAKRENLKARDFVFPRDRTWPIHDEPQAKLALIWSTWPQHKKVAKRVRDAVFKRHRGLKDWFKGGAYANEAAEELGVSLHEASNLKRRSVVEERAGLGTLGDVFRDSLEDARALLSSDLSEDIAMPRRYGATETVVEDAEEAVLVAFGRHGLSLSHEKKNALRSLLGRLAGKE